jgi:ArsR family transcriptional regulator, nickel/cobalt-responsive transcriptional repressor
MSHEGQRPAPDLPEIDDELGQDVAEAMQALASSTRIRMLARLQRSPMGVNQLAEAMGMDPSAVSHQLRLLRHLNLVKGSRRANRVIYSLHDDHVGVLLAEAVYHVTHVRIDELNRDLNAIPDAAPAPGRREPKPRAGRG